MNSYFKDFIIDGALTAIEDPVGVRCYLIRGSERAALIDTGTGLGNLAEHVGSLTALPLTVICTHGHIDHAGGASRFGRVYLPEADGELERRHCSYGMKLKQNELLISNGSEPVPPCDIAPQRTEPFLPLIDQSRFDLGGLTLVACAFPGHTRGMTCILIEERREMILGDACNPRVFLFGPESSSVEEYRSSVLDFKKRYASAFDTAYLSHGPSNTIDPAILDDCAELCTDIMEGRDDALPFAFMDERGTMAAAVNDAGNSANGRLANIVYDSARIMKNGK